MPYNFCIGRTINNHSIIFMAKKKAVKKTKKTKKVAKKKTAKRRK
ncbi:MAG TPA: hypothetical protein PLF31_01690 [Candidatus Paceibacterota bacterium]|nr:hypothetical protein [Candidatus Paceibacterota bacterium]